MNRFAAATLLVASFLACPAHAEFAGYFNLGVVTVPDLASPDWGRREADGSIRYLCAATASCPFPTGVEIKGVRRTERLPDAFRDGPLSPARLRAAGEARSGPGGSRFLLAEPYAIGGLSGVHMEASVEMGGTVHVVTRWIGQGDRLLEVKVTSPDLALARRLSDTALERLTPQVFPGR